MAGVAVLGAATVLAMRPDNAAEKEAAAQAATVQAHRKLATVSLSDRKNIDYATLDRRLRVLAEKPIMVGLAVGIVENGRITFLSGYGETLEGSGEKVTPETVFRW